MRESTIERAVCARAKQLGCMVIKLNGPGQRGLPDRMILRDGRALFIEFKAPGKKPTTLQLKTRDKLLALGFIATVIDDKDNGLATINYLFEQ
jgi:hypothetical protein